MRQALHSMREFAARGWRAARQRLSKSAGAPRNVRESELVRRSGLLDPTWYLETYPDVSAADVVPLRHYLAYGAAEDRDPPSSTLFCVSH